MSSPKMKPGYDPEELEKQLVEAVMDAYLNPTEDAADKNGCMQLKLLAEEFSMTPIKIRKLLVTSGKLWCDFWRSTGQRTRDWNS